MQKFYTDKAKLFECNIAIDGANLNETKARLVLEFPNKRSLLFHGNINKNGKCEVMIPALKEMDECEGNVLLEVIADSTYFESWSDKFKLQQNKKVVVEVFDSEKDIINEDKKIKPIVNIITEDIVEHIDTYANFKKYVVENKININQIVKSKDNFFKLLREYQKDSGVTKEDVKEIVNEIKTSINKNGVIVLNS